MDTISALPARARRWYELWWDAWRHPGAKTFRFLLNEPGTNATRGFIWVAAAALVAGILSVVLNSAVISSVSASQSSVFTTISNILTAPVGAVIGLAILAGFFHLAAQLFGGYGNWSQMVVCLAVIQAPLAVFAVACETLAGFLIGNGSGLILMIFVASALVIYSLVLVAGAVDSVEEIGTDKSILTILIPALVIFVIYIWASSISFKLD